MRVCVDDVIIFSKSVEEQAQRLAHVWQRFEKATLQLHPGK
jgi:hypothetical protein